jgi:quercetin dioxygenase-like cupin family protein
MGASEADRGGGAAPQGGVAGPGPRGEGVRCAQLLELAAAARATAARGPQWSAESADLDVNLLAFGAGEGVAAHVNAEVDVLLLGVSGSGTVAVDGASHHLAAGTLLLIPRGARRAIRSGSEGLAYLSCHRRREPLRPGRASGPAPAPRPPR